VLQHYVVSLAVEPGHDVNRPFDGFAEVAYENMEALRAAMLTTEARLMLEDEANLFDIASAIRLVVTEHRLLP
jgi:hypothetical protein